MQSVDFNDFKECMYQKNGYNYKITINISDGAWTKLKAANLNICLIKEIQCSEPLDDLLPTIWVSTSHFATKNVISWNYKHEAYLSTSRRDEVIVPLSTYQIDFNETLTFSNAGTKISAEPRKLVISLPYALTFYNESDSDLTVDLLQKITVNGQELGPTPITVQTLKKYSEKVFFLPERVLLTFVSPEIQVGQIAMERLTYPRIAVDFGPTDEEREIFWTDETEDGEPIEPGTWYILDEDNWGLVISTNCPIHSLLSRDDSDPSKIRKEMPTV